MKRRDFCSKAGCAAAGVMAASALLAQENQVKVPAKPNKYKIEIEIFEARKDTWCHKTGDKFAYPEEWGKICPWLQGSLRDFVIALKHGAVLPWRYEGTAYEKVIDPEGVTTEFVRCPDPTANLVAKITRTCLS